MVLEQTKSNKHIYKYVYLSIYIYIYLIDANCLDYLRFLFGPNRVCFSPLFCLRVQSQAMLSHVGVDMGYHWITLSMFSLIRSFSTIQQPPLVFLLQVVGEELQSLLDAGKADPAGSFTKSPSSMLCHWGLLVTIHGSQLLAEGK